VPRLRDEDTLYARELAGIRAFGSETELMQVMKEVARRFAGPTGLRNPIWPTRRNSTSWRAVQGKLIDSDGSVKYDWFAEFGITANPTVPFNLAGQYGWHRPSVAAGIKRTMMRKAQGAFRATHQRRRAVRRRFLRRLVTHTDVEKTYANWQAAQALREGSAFKAISSSPTSPGSTTAARMTPSASECPLTNGSAAATPTIISPASSSA
jgi:uncharacterized protein YerC